jgi:hypothetical protein
MMRFLLPVLVSGILAAAAQAQQTPVVPAQAPNPLQSPKVTETECAEWRARAATGVKLPPEILMRFGQCVKPKNWNNGIAPPAEAYRPPGFDEKFPSSVHEVTG